MKLSIIIPVYEPRQEDIIRCLDSIYSQNVAEKDFEVICVDDCSPSPYVQNIITQYRYQGNTPSNLVYIRHTHNTRQGGARNTAIKHVKGVYFTCIDQDDFYKKRSIENMLESQLAETDMVMFDYALSHDDCRIKIPSQYDEKDSAIMSGAEFLKSHAVSWMPWGYMYRSEFIREHGFKFEEQVRFEDVDFVLDCTAHAKTIKYVAQSNVVHRETDIQTSAVGNNREKNIDLVKIAYRVGILAEKLHLDGNPAWTEVMSHHSFMYKSALKKNIWRLQFKDIKNLFKEYPPVNSPQNSNLLRFIITHPLFSSITLCMMAPCLRGTYKIYSKIRNNIV